MKPDNTPQVIAIGSCMIKLGYLKPTINKLRSDTENVSLIDSRYLMNRINIEELRTKPVGTLGRAYADHMIINNLQPDFFESFPIVDDETYILLRMLQTHDLWHVFTNLDTSLIGEVGLFSFVYVQTQSPIGSILVGTSLLKRGITNSELTPKFFEAVGKNWLLGSQTRSIFALDWESHWDTSLSELRAFYDMNSAKKSNELDKFKSTAQLPIQPF